LTVMFLEFLRIQKGYDQITQQKNSENDDDDSCEVHSFTSDARRLVRKGAR